MASYVIDARAAAAAAEAVAGIFERIQVGDVIELRCEHCRQSLWTITVSEGPWSVDTSVYLAHGCTSDAPPERSAAGAGGATDGASDPAPGGDREA